VREFRTYISKNCPSNWTNAAANTPSPCGSHGQQLSTMLMRHAGTSGGETERWEQLSSQGQGVGEFRGDKIGNAWLRNPKLLKPSRHIDALKLRTNTYGTRVVLNRIFPINTMCRGCGMQRETLGHISSGCVIIRRTNALRGTMRSNTSSLKDCLRDSTPLSSQQ